MALLKRNKSKRKELRAGRKSDHTVEQVSTIYHKSIQGHGYHDLRYRINNYSTRFLSESDC